MTIYLGASWVDDDTVALEWGENPLPCLSQRSGRVSPVFPLVPSDQAILPVNGYLLFLFPSSPRQLLADIQDDFPDQVVQSTYMTHGLAACIITLPQGEDTESLIAQLTSRQALSYELWPFKSRIVNLRDIRIGRAPLNEIPNLEPMDFAELPEPVAQEVRQFNANLALLASISREYLPEYLDLLQWLVDSVRSRIEKIRLEKSRTHSMSALGPRLHHDVSILVDVNSCLTMVISQSAGVLPPILNSNYPVGEFSLLGVGSAIRAAWKFYESISRVFARADHVTRLRTSFSTPAFDPAFVPSLTDFGSWKHAASSSVAAQTPDDERPGRKHLVYFSSRWGFHETLNSISISWQSITACATKHWNLLTLSHEFLHSHFRELVRTNVLDVTNDEQLQYVCQRYNEMWSVGWLRQPGDAHQPFTYLDSFRAFLLNQLSWCHQAAAYKGTNGSHGDPEWAVHELSSEDATHLINTYMAENVEEYVVHIMDYLYFFDGDDDAYLSSLWHSWSLVPFVHKKLPHYLLRSLLALASTAAGHEPEVAFSSSLRRLALHFQQMERVSSNPIAVDALRIMHDTEQAESLWIDFKYSYQLVPFTKMFLIDPTLNSKLTFDPLTSSGQRYPFREGEFSSSAISSPAAFLLDRYENGHDENEDVSHVSLWQLLMLL